MQPDIHEFGVVTGAIAALSAPASTPIGFVALYRDRYDAMVRLAAMLVDRVDVAEEVVQDAFAAVYERWANVDTPAAYVRTVVVNRCRDVLRRRRVAAAITLGRAQEEAEPTGDLLHDALAALPARQRAVLVLRFYEDLPNDEVARLMKTRPGTVKSLVHRGLNTLREVIEE
jgi:RNA polymerase sigma-70 factor (sigma-E family)